MAKLGKTPPGGFGDSSPTPKKGGGKKSVSNSDAKIVRGKNKGPLSFQKPKKPTTPTFGDGA